MPRSWLVMLSFAAVLFTAQTAMAQTVHMKWGLENTWSYYEVPEGRAEDEDGATRRAESKAPRYRAFAFNDREDEVREPWLACINSTMELWDRYSQGAPTKGIEGERKHFVEYAKREDPGCMGQFMKTAPRLYFDFTSDSSDEFVLERVEVTTLGFSEYMGGGFAEKEAWYDILLSHREGTKSYFPEPRLVYKGHGRVTLRLWSDNFYPGVGWIAPMGEYTIDIHFVFSAGDETVTINTGPFKIDV